MYDLPEIREATDAWWRGLAAAFRAEGLTGVPDVLTRSDTPSHLWGEPDLLLSQTCGYPLTHAWAGRLQVVATPAYGLEGCEGCDYCSFILVRRCATAVSLEDLRGARAAFNGPDSQSGYSALRAVFAPLARDGRFFGELVKSGGHLNSIRMVAAGDADVCAVDSVVWTLARTHCSDLTDELRAIATSPPAPGLPYVTRPDIAPDDLARLRSGLRAAVADAVLAEARHVLSLEDFEVLPDTAYDRIMHIEQDAEAAGYASLG